MPLANLKSVVLAVPETIAIEVQGEGCEPPILEKRRAQGTGMSIGEFL